MLSGPTFVDPKAPLTGPTAGPGGRHGSATGLGWGSDLRVDSGPLPPGPARGHSGQQKWVPGADNMVSPYFEGAESISGLGLPQVQPFRGVLG